MYTLTTKGLLSLFLLEAMAQTPLTPKGELQASTIIDVAFNRFEHIMLIERGIPNIWRQLDKFGG